MSGPAAAMDGEDGGGQSPLPALVNPAAMRAYIVERMVGSTGAPAEVVEAGRSVGGRLGPLFARTLAAALPVPLDVTFLDARLLRLGEAHPAERGAVMSSVGLGSESGLLVLDGAGVDLAVGVMFGADPLGAAIPLAREPSPIERDVAGVVLQAFGQALAEAADPVPTLPLPALLSGAALEREPRRDVAAVALSFRLGGAEGGTLTFALPQRLVLRRARPAGEDGADWGGRISGELMRSTVSIQATMVLGRLTLGELDALVPGMVVPLEAQASTTAKLSARGRTIFSGEFGQIDGRYSLLLGEPFDAAADLMQTLSAAR